MKLNWFSKKDNNFPDFWKEYIGKFKQNSKLTIEECRFVVFDTETTGFDKKKDRILSIGAVSLINNTIDVSKAFELYLEQEIFKPDSVEIHGILKKGNLVKVTELEAIKQFLEYIKNSVLVGHHIGFDYGVINQMLMRNGLEKLKNLSLDTGTLFKKSKHLVYQDNLKHYSLDDLCEELKVEKIDRHTASGDALITAVVFLKILSRLNKNKKLTLSDLFK